MSESLSKSQPFNDIPTKIVKDNQDISSNFITRTFNSGIPTVCHHPKNAEVKPLFKNSSRTNKTNYRPVSLLSVISKVYERLICKQVSEYFEPILSKYQCGFRTDPSA